MRVLVVEDDRNMGDLFEDLLRQLGHEPVLVRTAEAALGTLETQNPDAVILDIRLPGMSGLEFLRFWPVRESGLPVIAVSGVATNSEAGESLRLGAVEFMGKPIGLETLGNVLSSLEPYARRRRVAEIARKVNRRRVPRAPLAIPVRVVENDATEWRGTSVDLSVLGMKVMPDGPVTPGRMATISFTPPDGGAPLEVLALLVHSDAGGHAFYFGKLGDDDFRRLEDVVARLGDAGSELDQGR